MIDSWTSLAWNALENIVSLSFFTPAILFGVACFFTSGLWFWCSLLLAIVSFFGMIALTAWTDEKNDAFCDEMLAELEAEERQGNE